MLTQRGGWRKGTENSVPHWGGRTLVRRKTFVEVEGGKWGLEGKKNRERKNEATAMLFGKKRTWT